MSYSKHSSYYLVLFFIVVILIRSRYSSRQTYCTLSNCKNVPNKPLKFRKTLRIVYFFRAEKFSGFQIAKFYVGLSADQKFQVRITFIQDDSLIMEQSVMVGYWFENRTIKSNTLPYVAPFLQIEREQHLDEAYLP